MDPRAEVGEDVRVGVGPMEFKPIGRIDVSGESAPWNASFTVLPTTTWSCVHACRFGESPRTVDDILTAVVREFGPVALRPVHKGVNVGWFLDQMTVSVLVADWTRRRRGAAGRVKFVPRDVGVDRLDRAAWGLGGPGVGDKIDAHLPGNAYLPGVWAQIMPLVSHLHGYETDTYRWCTDYYDHFQKLFVDKQARRRGV